MKRKQVKDKSSIQDDYYLGLEGIKEMKEEDAIGRGILPNVLVFILNRGFKNVYHIITNIKETNKRAMLCHKPKINPVLCTQVSTRRDYSCLARSIIALTY